MPGGTSSARRLRPSPSIIISIFALVIAMSSGAYAAVTVAEKNSVVSKSIKNKTIKAKDLADGSVTTAKLKDNGVIGSKVADGSLTGADLVDGSVGSADIADLQIGTSDFADGSVTTTKLADGSVTTAKIANDAVTSAKIPDFGLTNQDVGVLYAVVAANGTLARSSGGVTSSRTSQGRYSVGFGRDISECAFVGNIATTGNSGTAGPGEIEFAGLAGDVTGIFVRILDSAGNPAGLDTSFHVVVVC